MLCAWLGDPVNWPLFMKKAVAGTGEYGTSPAGSSPWPGHARRDRSVLPTPELAGRHQRLDEEAANGRGVMSGINPPQQTGAATGEQRDISWARRIGGSLLVFFTGFLVWFLWPVAVLYGLVWWFIYGIWAWDYIYLSTRRHRSLAQIHARAGDQQRSIHEANNSAVMVTYGVSVTREGANGLPTPIPPLIKRDENNCANVTAGGAFYHFYPQAGKLSRKVKTILDYESAMPTPLWSKTAMLHAERKRRDRLDGGLPDQSPREGVKEQNCPGRLSTPPNEHNTVILEARIPIRQSSVHQNGRRLKRQPRLDPWPRRLDGDIELRNMMPSTMSLTTDFKVDETTITLASVPERRGSAQRTGATNGKRNGNHQKKNGGGSSSEGQTLPAPFRPPNTDRMSSMRARGLFTIEEGDVAEEEDRSSDESLDTGAPQVSSHVANGA